MSEALQWSAAVIVLVAYALSMRGVWPVRSYRYLGFNLIGGFGLSAAAVISHQWGFVLLEGVWGAAAGWGIIARVRGREIRVPADVEPSSTPDSASRSS
jgi:hypothetical protein